MKWSRTQTSFVSSSHNSVDVPSVIWEINSYWELMRATAMPCQKTVFHKTDSLFFFFFWEFLLSLGMDDLDDPSNTCLIGVIPWSWRWFSQDKAYPLHSRYGGGGGDDPSRAGSHLFSGFWFCSNCCTLHKEAFLTKADSMTCPF